MKKNKKNSYYSLFLSSFYVAAIGIVVLSIFICIICNSLVRREKFKDISMICGNLTTIIEGDLETAEDIRSDSVQRVYKSFSEQYGLSLYIYDEDGGCVLNPENENGNIALPTTTMERIDNEPFFDFDAQKISNTEPRIMYGASFSVESGTDAEHKFYIIAYCPVDDINSFNYRVIFYVCAFSLLLILIMYLVMRHKASKYVTASEEFKRISEKFSRGDFSERIDVGKYDCLQDISRNINALADNMANSDATSKTFIANVSHELRTPITTVGGFVDGIIDGTIPKSQQREYLILVSNEIKRLRILITSMLNMTKFESGTMTPNFKPVNLTDIVIQVVLMFEKKINEKKVEIEGLDSDRLMAVADPDLMQQVIYNIVENAVKFVNVNGTISFSFENNNGICSIGIRNTGEGLKNEEIKQVFDRFYKTDSSRGKDTTGLGLGLSISRKIVHLHKGHIVVKSVYGQYTEFSIQIPEKQD